MDNLRERLESNWMNVTKNEHHRINEGNFIWVKNENCGNGWPKKEGCQKIN